MHMRACIAEAIFSIFKYFPVSGKIYPPNGAACFSIKHAESPGFPEKSIYLFLYLEYSIFKFYLSIILLCFRHFFKGFFKV